MKTNKIYLDKYLDLIFFIKSILNTTKINIFNGIGKEKHFQLLNECHLNLKQLIHNLVFAQRTIIIKIKTTRSYKLLILDSEQSE